MKINLPNRDGVDVWLEKEDNGVWTLKSSKDYITKFMRVGYSENEAPEFIDPPGGPFLQVGNEVGGRKILGITKNLEIILDESNFTICDGNEWTAYYQGNPGKFKEWLKGEGFIDADILGPNWYVYGYEVYQLPLNWRSQIIQDEYVTLDYVGHLEHVIPRKSRSPEQWWFIKRIFGD